MHVQNSCFANYTYCFCGVPVAVAVAVAVVMLRSLITLARVADGIVSVSKVWHSALASRSDTMRMAVLPPKLRHAQK